MTDMKEARHPADMTFSANSFRACKAPAPDSWVWDVPAFRSYISHEDSHDLQTQDDLINEVDVFITEHRLVGLLIFSILTGFAFSLASLALGYSYVIATLSYATGGFCGFILASGANFMRAKAD